MATYKVDLKYKNADLASTGWNIRQGIRVDASSVAEAKTKAKEQIQRSMPGKNLKFEFDSVSS